MILTINQIDELYARTRGFRRGALVTIKNHASGRQDTIEARIYHVSMEIDWQGNTKILNNEGEKHGT